MPSLWPPTLPAEYTDPSAPTPLLWMTSIQHYTEYGRKGVKAMLQKIGYVALIVRDYDEAIAF